MRTLVLSCCATCLLGVLAICSASEPADNNSAQNTEVDSSGTAHAGNAAQGDEIADRIQSALRKRLDKDSDGSLSSEELEQAREEANVRMRANREALQKRFDKNEDGTLDAEERRAMRKMLADRAARRAQPTIADRKPRLDQSMLLERFDENKNGMLDANERTLIVAELKRLRNE